MDVQRILCPVDLSPLSRRALETAVALARAWDAVVDVLEVIDTSLLPGVATGSRAMVDLSGYQQEFDAFVQATEASDVKITRQVVEGRTPAAIVDAAAGLRTDVIVMGTHGRHGFDRFVLGSVTARVLRKAPCRVLAVPPPPTGAAPAWPPARSIVCPVDFSSSSLAALEEAVAWAKQFAARLTAVHVLEWPFGDWHHEAFPFPIEELGRSLEDQARQRLHQCVVDAKTMAEEIVLVGKPARALVDFVSDRPPDLVVMGATGRGALGLALLGSTAERVIVQSPCPVLTLAGHLGHA
jgi:nucleotide-binding universal stress UspA family protein